MCAEFTKSRELGTLSKTTSNGYELEDAQPDQALLYKPFFRYTLYRTKVNIPMDKNSKR